MHIDIYGRALVIIGVKAEPYKVHAACSPITKKLIIIGITVGAYSAHLPRCAFFVTPTSDSWHFTHFSRSLLAAKISPQTTHHHHRCYPKWSASILTSSEIFLRSFHTFTVRFVLEIPLVCGRCYTGGCLGLSGPGSWHCYPGKRRAFLEYLAHCRIYAVQLG